MVKESTTFKNCQDLFNRNPTVLKEYANYYYPSELGYTKSFYRKLVEIERFLKFYHKNKLLDIAFNELSHHHLEVLPLDIIEKYFNTLKTEKSNKRTILSTLSSFWNYYTYYSFNLEKGKPIFYRNAFNEWKVGYKKSYQSIKNDTDTNFKILYSIEELSDFLNFYDNSFVLFLDTLKKVENFKAKKERDLAAIALLMGTGITVEELCLLTIKNIDMRKRKLTFLRDGKPTEIKILDFACPYISPYISTRRNLSVDNGRVPQLFLGKFKSSLGATSFTNIISELSVKAKKPLTSLIIRNSYKALV